MMSKKKQCFNKRLKPFENSNSVFDTLLVGFIGHRWIFHIEEYFARKIVALTTMVELLSCNAGIEGTGIEVHKFCSEDFAFFGITSFARIVDEFFVFVAFKTSNTTIDTTDTNVWIHSS